MRSGLRDRRKALGISLREMASRLGWSPSYVSDLELGRRRSHDVARVAKAYEMTEILTGSVLGVCLACKGTGRS